MIIVRLLHSLLREIQERIAAIWLNDESAAGMTVLTAGGFEPRKSPKRMAFTDVDCLVFAGLYHLAPGVPNALKIVKPATVIRWHRAGFRAYWRKDQGRARAGHRHRLSYAGSFAMSV